MIYGGWPEIAGGGHHGFPCWTITCVPAGQHDSVHPPGIAAAQHWTSGRNPEVQQSGVAPGQGRFIKQGREQTRCLMFEAAWSFAQAIGTVLGLCRALPERRGRQTAVVALAGEMTVLC